MDVVIPYILRSGDWIISFVFLYLIIRLYVMRHIEELSNKITKIEEKIENYNTRYEHCQSRKIDRAEYYADYSEFKAELQELRKDIKNIYFMLGGDKCSGMRS